MSILTIVAIVCAGLFAGAAIYINAVEHPARMECGIELALRQWRPSYGRATWMQAPLALLGSVAAVIVWVLGRDPWYLVSALLLASVIPVTMLIIFPTNKQLLSREAEADLSRAADLLRRWNRLHMIRSVLATCSFILMLTRSIL